MILSRTIPLLTTFVLFSTLSIEAQAESSSVCITEIMYHPISTGAEFLELKNIGATTVDLSGAYFSVGIDFTFPAGTEIEPGAHLVLTSAQALFTSNYPGVPVAGVFLAVLSNAGERVILNAANNSVLTSVDYNDIPPWPVGADGAGFSLTVIDPMGDLNLPSNWRHSSVLGGTPGADDAGSNPPTIIINEALTHSDPPQVDVVELYNPNATEVDVRGWLLTDDIGVPAKARIPDQPQYVIPAGGYALVDENVFALNPGFLNGQFLPGFRLSSFGGERILLLSADSTGTLTGAAHGYAFGASENGVSFGRVVTTDNREYFVSQSQNSFGAANLGPQSDPLVISEVYYAPRPGDVEYIELTNTGSIEARLWDTSFGGDPTNTYEISGIGFSFPMNTALPAGASLLVVNDDPDAFRARLSVPAEVGVFGPMGNNSTDGIASLSDRGERVTLLFPDPPDGGIVPLFALDIVRYSSGAPWPDALGTGNSIRRINAATFGSEPTNWEALEALYGSGGMGDPAIISVSPLALDFGTVLEGESVDLMATVMNIGGEVLAGSAVATAPFEVVSGPMYTLDPGASQMVTVRFTPTLPGEVIGEASFSGGGGMSIDLQGEGLAPAPEIAVMPAELNFGAVMVGEEASLTVNVMNVGGGTLQGSASINPPFSLSGSADYMVLAVNATQLTIVFTPTAAGMFTDDLVLTGGGGASVTVEGESVAVEPPPDTGCGATPINGLPSSRAGDFLLVAFVTLLLLGFSRRHLGLRQS